MRGWNPRGLRVRLLALVLLAVLPALVLTLYTVLAQRRLARLRAEEEALRLARMASATEERVLEGGRQLLMLLAKLPEVQACDPERSSPLLADLLRQYPLYANFGVTTTNGLIICSALPIAQPVPVADRTWYQRAMRTRRFAVGDYQIGRITGKPTINLSYPLLGPTGVVRAVFFAALDLEWLHRLVASARLPAGATLMVLDRQGTILTRYPNPETWIGRSLPHVPLVRLVLAQRGEGTSQSTGLDGRQQLYAFAPLTVTEAGPTAYVVVGVPLSLAYAEANDVLRHNLLLVTVVTVLAMLVAWIAQEFFILRDARALVGATQRLQAGDFTARTQVVHDRGEFGQLATAFDEMAHSLEQRLAERERAAAALRALNTDLERRVAERTQQLRTSESWLRGIIDGTSDLIAAVDPEFRLIAFNRAFEQTWGRLFGTKLAVGLSLREALAHRPTDQAKTLELWRRALRGEQFTVTEEFGEAKNPPVYYEITGNAIRGANGELIGAAAVGRDVTARKHAEEALRHTAAELGRSNAELEQFASIASHDLQEPLRMVSSFTQLLAQRYHGKLDIEADEFISYAVGGALRMKALLDDLLRYSRVTTCGHAFLATDSTRACECALANLKIAIDESAATVTTDPLPIVTADPGQLTELFQNLIGNAIKYRRAEPPRVHVSARRTDQVWDFTVRDNGIGIEPQDFERIFVIFQRLHHDKQYPGTGLGLAVCKKIVERHGGRIWVESQPGLGSTFHFTLPAL